jgi:hypothetical protein
MVDPGLGGYRRPTANARVSYVRWVRAAHVSRDRVDVHPRTNRTRYESVRTSGDTEARTGCPAISVPRPAPCPAPSSGHGGHTREPPRRHRRRSLTLMPTRPSCLYADPPDETRPSEEGAPLSRAANVRRERRSSRSIALRRDLAGAVPRLSGSDVRCRGLAKQTPFEFEPAFTPRHTDTAEAA